MMKRFIFSLLIIGGLISLPGTLRAQEIQPTELFGGYTYMGSDLGIEGLDSFGLQGVHLEATRFFSPRLGVAAEFSAHFGSSSTELSGIDQLHVNQYSFLVGPRLMSRGFWRIQLSSRALLGITAVDIDTDSTEEVMPAGAEQIARSESNFTIALGASLDLRLSERVSLRLIQSNQLFTFTGGDSFRNNRYSSGLLVRF